jgi:hypothetical protein
MALAGCSLLGLGNDAIVGTWNLTSVTVTGYGTVTAAQAGLSWTIVAKSDKTISMSMTETASGVTQSTTGTWSKSGSTYSLTAQGSTQTATISGSTLTVTLSGVSYAFTKS